MRRGFVFSFVVAMALVAGGASAQLNEDFASYPPTGWTEAQGTLAAPTVLSGTSSNWTSDTFGNDGTHPNGSCAKINIYGTTMDEWLFSPTFSLPAVPGHGTVLQFDLALTVWNSTTGSTLGTDDVFAVVISTDGGATYSDTNVLQQWDDTTSISATGDAISIPLGAYTGSVQLGFYGYSDTSNADNDLFVDNVLVYDPTGPPACGVLPDAPDDGATGVDLATTLDWFGSFGATGYTLYFGTDGGGVTSPTNLVNGVGQGNVLTYNPGGGLANGTVHYWQIAPSNANGTATGCPIWSFTTVPAPIYTVDDACATAFEDISGSGTPLGLADDGEAAIQIPFDFGFYGVMNTAPIDVTVANNGVLVLNEAFASVGYTNSALPYASYPQTIMPFWDDVDDETGDVYWEVRGTAPNRRLIVQWDGRPHANNIDDCTFQAVLYESTGVIEFVYSDTDFGNPTYDFGASATIGLQDTGVGLVDEYSYNTASLATATAVTCINFTPSSVPVELMFFAID